MIVKKRKAEFVRWMGPVLDALRKLGGSGTPREVSDLIAEELKIPDSKREETLKSGASRYHNQVQWARQYLVWEGMIESSKRGVWSLTTKGFDTHLSEQDDREIFRKWVSFHAETRRTNSKTQTLGSGAQLQIFEDPEVNIEDDYKKNLLEILKNLSPGGFENICGRLLREHNFEKVEITGRSHDQGIDAIGILKINSFVRFKVLVQCKKYNNKPVTSEHIAHFRNAMMGRADKGIIITTGNFTSEAIREATREGVLPIELVDGEKLVEMFKEVELGLIPVTTYEIDREFFLQYMPKD